MPPRPDIDEDFIDGVEYRPGRLEIRASYDFLNTPSHLSIALSLRIEIQLL